MTTTSTQHRQQPAPAQESIPDIGDMEGFSADMISRRATVLATIAAALGSGIYVFVLWLILKQIDFPAFNTSMVTRALSTAGTTLVLVFVAVLVMFWARDEARTALLRIHAREAGASAEEVAAIPTSHPRWRLWLTYVTEYLAAPTLVMTAIGLPLASTRLWLDGVQVDQSFRTSYLTRMTEGIGLSDMSYIDLPSFYPAGWFWLAGRFANLTGLEGWEAFQPFALITLGVSGSILVPIWQRLTGSLSTATGISLVTTGLALVVLLVEPYSAAVAMLSPAGIIAAHKALRGSRFAMAPAIVYLGLSATFYTLYTAVLAISVVLIAIILSATRRSWDAILRLLVMGLGSSLIALLVWGPFLWALLSGAPTGTTSPTHYLPEKGATIPTPFFSPSLIGILCLIGLVFLVLRYKLPEINALTITVIVIYVWCLASMLASLAGTSLLGFRLEHMLTIFFSTAGVICLAQLRLTGIQKLYPSVVKPQVSRLVTVVMVILLMAGGIHYATHLPEKNERYLEHAYQNSDGFGERGDQRKPDAAQFYAQIDEHIQSFGYVPSDTVVLTDENVFMAYKPYYGFQAFTGHYANPLGQYEDRSVAIASLAEDSWTKLSSPESFRKALDTLPWRAPDVFIMRGAYDAAQPGWKYTIAEDIFPSEPNIRFKGMFFNPESFQDSSLWDITQIGPFVVVTRVK